MAKTLVQDNGVLLWTNGTGAAVVSGQLVKAQNMLGVALVDIANGASGSVDFTPGRIYSGVAKVSGAVFVNGEKLIFDVSANSGAGALDDSAATPATGDVTGAVIAIGAGGNGETTCTVMLTPGNSTVT
jgi:predicted RecA/RadA family phage recombinase